MARKATPKETVSWSDVIQTIMKRDGVDEETANTNLANLLHNVQHDEDLEKWRGAVEAVAKDRKIEVPEAEEEVSKFFTEFKASQVDAWTDVIHHIMERDGVTEVAANDNFNNLLSNLGYEEALKREQG